MKFHTIPLDDPRVVALARARQQLAHEYAHLPAWEELTDDERASALPDARNYLQSAIDAGLVDIDELPPVAVPEIDACDVEYAREKVGRYDGFAAPPGVRAEIRRVLAEEDADEEPNILRPMTEEQRAEAARYYLDDPAYDAAQLREQSRYAVAAATLLEAAAHRGLSRATVTIGLGGIVVRLAGYEENRREAFAAWAGLLDLPTGEAGGKTSTAEPGLLVGGVWQDVQVALASGEIARRARAEQA